MVPASPEQVKELPGQVVCIEKGGVSPAGEACLHHQASVVDITHERPVRLALHKMDACLFDDL